MSHFAKIDENNIVINVVVGNNNDPNGDEGYQWVVNNLDGVWIKTSYNTIAGVHYLPDENRNEEGYRIPSGKPHLRFNYASIGYSYDADKDAFIAPKCHSEAVLDETTCCWNCSNAEH